MSSEKDFVSIYNDVFDQNGNIKPCGRTITSKLIELAQVLKPGIDFGNKNTGVMNVVNIKALFSELK